MKRIFLLLFLTFNWLCYSQNLPLNNILISEISLPKDDNMYITIGLDAKNGSYRYRFKNQEVTMVYYNKNIDPEEFDSPLAEGNIRYFSLIEGINSGEIEKIPRIAWLHNMRFNIINGIKYFDSFMFYADEATDKQLTRVLYFTTENYYIRIMIGIPYNDREELFSEIYGEVPQYFQIVYYESIIGRNGHEFIIWDNESNGKIECANDLLNGINRSRIINQWFRDTEEIVSRIVIK
jgi:hypothetical protein